MADKYIEVLIPGRGAEDAAHYTGGRRVDRDPNLQYGVKFIRQSSGLTHCIIYYL